MVEDRRELARQLRAYIRRLVRGMEPNGIGDIVPGIGDTDQQLEEKGGEFYFEW